MRKVALIFTISVLGPSLVLGWLAIRSLSAQQLVFERQQTLLFQGVCDSLVKDILELVAERRREFARQVELRLSQAPPLEAAQRFDLALVENWPLADVGFVVTLDGQILSPSLLGRPEAKRFRLENDSFLSNRESVEVYWRSPKGDIPLSQLDEKPAPAPLPESGSEGKFMKGDKSRKVFPQKEPQPDGKGGSRVTAEEAEFQRFVKEAPEGMLARFLQNKLRLLIWYRSPRTTNLVFGAALKVALLQEAMRPLVRPGPLMENQACVALLDEHGRPIARSHPTFSTDWRRPFVSAEIGEVLPHWEIAAYLLNPDQMAQSGRTLALTLGLLIGVLLLAIGIGGGLVVADVRRQVLLARQKTDFVSNVSHELKTPLTSIRMFSELLAESRVTDPDKQRTYLGVIAGEAARLTRLINNVLDFARTERGERSYHFQRYDLVTIVREVTESFRPQMESSGFAMEVRFPASPIWIRADRDAVAQLTLNLLSNVEKYSGGAKQATIELRVTPPGADGSACAELRVLDRGPGVPSGLEEKIFEQFYRAHDSLNSGIPGSGLGLTLARQIARAHGGDVQYQPRPGGGSCFICRLPYERQDSDR